MAPTTKADAAIQREVLDGLESTRFQWYHVKAIIICGSGFFTDSYDLFVIGLVVPMIGYVYYPQAPFNGRIPRKDDLLIKGSALVGTIVGQVAFGIIGDRFGRKKAYLLTLIMMVFCTVAQAMAASTVKGWGVVTFICIWRFLLGIGIGGDYPLSAAITCEYSNTRLRGAIIGSVYAIQSFGLIGSALMGVITTRAFKSLIIEDIRYLDYVWRIMIGFGVIPAMLTIYIRSQLPETPRYTLQVVKDAELAQAHMSAVRQNGKWDESQGMTKDSKAITFSSFLNWVCRSKNAKILFGTTSTYFLIDVIFYSQNLFTPSILSNIGYVPAAKVGIPTQVYERIYKNAIGNLVVCLMGAVPGYWFTVFTVDKLGRKFIHWMGCSLTLIGFIVLSIWYPQIVKHKWLFIFLFAFTAFWQNWGPHMTMFIVPAEIFPTRYRATCHGMSAASGKIGATVGTFGIGDVNLKYGTRPAMYIFAGTAFLLMFTPFFFPETKGRTLEDLLTEFDMRGEEEEGSDSVSSEDDSPKKMIQT